MKMHNRKKEVKVIVREVVDAGVDAHVEVVVAFAAATRSRTAVALACIDCLEL